MDNISIDSSEYKFPLKQGIKDPASKAIIRIVQRFNIWSKKTLQDENNKKNVCILKPAVRTIASTFDQAVQELQTFNQFDDNK